MKIAGRLWLALLLVAGMMAVGCEKEDGGTTDPIPDPTPSGDITVSPDEDGTMAPLSSAVQAARAGNVIVVLPGAYSGTLVIDKPLTFLSSAGKDNTILTNETDTTTVIVRISGSFGSADSLIFDGLGFNSGGRGMHVESSSVPIAANRCDFRDNATVGLQVGDDTGKAGGEPTLHLWQCFFRQNGGSGTSLASSAGLWSTTTVTGSSIFFEANDVDIALSNAALANLQRVTTASTQRVSLYLDGGSEMTLDGIDSGTPTKLRDGEGWAAQIVNSTLSISNYDVQRFATGGFDLVGSTVTLNSVLIEDIGRFGIRSEDSSVDLTGSQIVKTIGNQSGSGIFLEFGYAIYAQSTDGQPHPLKLTNCTILTSYRAGIQAYGLGQTVELVTSILEDNGTRWRDFQLPNDPNPPVGGALGLFNEATATLSDTQVRLNHGASGGGLALVGSGVQARIQGGEVWANSADSLGAGILVNGAICEIQDSSLRANSTSDRGGGAAVLLGASFTALNTSLLDNSANRGGGGAYVFRAGSSFSDGTEFTSNRAERRGTDPFSGGGGIHLSEATAVLDGAIFDGNVADLGGGLYATALIQDLTIRRAIFRGNVTTEIGGGLFALDLTRELRIEDSQFYGNSHKIPIGAGSSAIYSRQDLPGGQLTIKGCTITDNVQGQGAIGQRSGKMTITESVVAFNQPAGLIGDDLLFVEMSCNDFWSNGDLDYGPGADPGPGSFSQDPLFCDRANREYTVDSSSPLLPANNGCSVRIGARGQGCTAKQ